MNAVCWWACSFGTDIYITFPLLRIPQPCDVSVQPPAWHLWTFTLARLPLFAPLICHTIRPALRMERTGDLRTSLLHFPFWTGPHAVFLITISFSNLLIRHCDMLQFRPVTQLAPTCANWFQVIAPCSQWVRGLLLFHHEWSLFSFFFLTSLFVFNRL